MSKAKFPNTGLAEAEAEADPEAAAEAETGYDDSD